MSIYFFNFVIRKKLLFMVSPLCCEIRRSFFIYQILKLHFFNYIKEFFSYFTPLRRETRRSFY